MRVFYRAPYPVEVDPGEVVVTLDDQDIHTLRTALASVPPFSEVRQHANRLFTQLQEMRTQ